MAEHIDTIEEKVENNEKEIVTDKIKSASSNRKSHMSITERIAKQKEIQDNSKVADENKTEVSVIEKEKSNKPLYSRSGFRKRARQSAVDDAPKNISGEMICPTCGKVIPEAIIQDTVNGPRKRVGYDLDHYPDTWAERVEQLKQRDPPPTRKEVLEEYNRDLRVQCPKCNQGHEFEGVEGMYKGEK